MNCRQPQRRSEPCRLISYRLEMLLTLTNFSATIPCGWLVFVELCCPLHRQKEPTNAKECPSGFLVPILQDGSPTRHAALTALDVHLKHLIHQHTHVTACFVRDSIYALAVSSTLNRLQPRDFGESSARQLSTAKFLSECLYPFIYRH